MRLEGTNAYGSTYSCNMANNNHYTIKLNEKREIAKVIRKEGLIYDEVVARFGPMSRTTYCRIINSQNLERDFARIRERRKTEVIDMCIRNATYEEIAARMNWALATCKQYIADLYEVYCQQALKCKPIDRIQEIAKAAIAKGHKI